VYQIGILWEKADECARAIKTTSNPSRRKTLILMRKVWIALVDEGPFLDDNELIAWIGRIHTDVLELTAN
jgi:hypothetical protein